MVLPRRLPERFVTTAARRASRVIERRPQRAFTHRGAAHQHRDSVRSFSFYGVSRTGRKNFFDWPKFFSRSRFLWPRFGSQCGRRVGSSIDFNVREAGNRSSMGIPPHHLPREKPRSAGVRNRLANIHHGCRPATQRQPRRINSATPGNWMERTSCPNGE